jgi:ABC-type molybdate transport system substrate-binding protein
MGRDHLSASIVLLRAVACVTALVACSFARPVQAACRTTSTPVPASCANAPCGKSPPGVPAAVSCNLISAPSAGPERVIIYHAGSLGAAFTPVEQSFVCTTGIEVVDCSGGSLDLARQITSGGFAADIYAPADYLDIELFLKPAGFADFDVLVARGK